MQIKNSVHRRLLKKTFQSYEEVAEALKMAGVSNGWRAIADQMAETPTTIKSRSNRLVERRNQIVHESDLRRLVRPQGLSFNTIEAGDVNADVEWITGLIVAIDGLVT